LKVILGELHRQFGQLINFHKSAVVFSNNATQRQKQTVASVFKFPEDIPLAKYLGCLLIQGRTRKEMSMKLSDKANKEVTAWKTTSQSKAG